MSSSTSSGANQEHLVGIVERCLSMDRIAVQSYRIMATRTADLELATVWREMAREEEEHVAVWEDLLKLMLDRDLPQLFTSPARTLGELRDQHERVRALVAQDPGPTAVRDQLLAAFRLEFYILHPALERLWQFYQLLRGEDRSPLADYESHVRKFMNTLARWGAGNPELVLLGEAVLRMWTQIRELSHEASVDALTRILNRRGLFTTMKMLAYLARRNSHTAGALLIDIDHFKRINDTYGHQAGDEILTGIAQTISDSVRRSDVVGRYGSEEFLVFLPQVDIAGLAVLGEKVRAAVERRSGEWVGATVSVGAACTGFADSVEAGLDRLLLAADRHLYRAKASGRNQVVAETAC